MKVPRDSSNVHNGSTSPKMFIGVYNDDCEWKFTCAMSNESKVQCEVFKNHDMGWKFTWSIRVCTRVSTLATCLLGSRMIIGSEGSLVQCTQSWRFVVEISKIMVWCESSHVEFECGQWFVLVQYVYYNVEWWSEVKFHLCNAHRVEGSMCNFRKSWPSVKVHMKNSSVHNSFNAFLMLFRT